MDPDISLRNLLEKYLHNTCTEPEIQILLDLFKRAKNEPEIKRILSTVWHEIDESHPSERVSLSQEKDEWFEEIYSLALKREATFSGKNQGKPTAKKTGLLSYEYAGSQWLRVAAILLFSVIISSIFFSIRLSGPVDSAVYEQKQAGLGEKVRFMLSDGTQVHLNSESRLEYPVSFTESAREVRLNGEAYFIVTHDETRPFLVHAGEITTKVLGTSFSIRSYPEDGQIIVAVTSGKVSVAESGTDTRDINKDVILKADQWANYTFDKRSFDTGNDITAYTAWNNGVLLYHDKKIGEVSSQLERWYGVDITFENEAIKSCVVWGEHRDETLENVLKAITYAFDMDYRIEGRQVKLTGRGCR